MDNPFNYLWVAAIPGIISLIYFYRKIETPSEEKYWNNESEKEN